MTQDELNLLIDSHEEWLSTAGVSGYQLIFENIFLAGMSFSGRNLSQCILSGTNLTFGKFDNSLFVGADLHGSLLSGSDLSNADFSNSNLSYSICNESVFTGAIFTGADMTGSIGYPA